MGMHIPYSQETFRPGDDILPGNSRSDNPLVFHLVPAWGSDIARIRSIVHATTGLAQGRDWSPETQSAVIAAFETGAPAFVNTVVSIQGLTIPAIMAKRAGLLVTLPTRVEGGQSVEDPQAPFPITNGFQLSQVCGALIVISLHVAMKIGSLTDKAERAMDPRFFKQPSGSGGTGTGRKAKGSNARTARPTSRRRGTAASDSTPTGT